MTTYQGEFVNHKQSDSKDSKNEIDYEPLIRIITTPHNHVVMGVKKYMDIHNDSTTIKLKGIILIRRNNSHNVKSISRSSLT